MLVNKYNAEKIKCYYKHGADRPDISLKCVACKAFKSFCDFFNYPVSGDVFYIENMSLYSGPCGRCGFPNCEGWIERES